MGLSVEAFKIYGLITADNSELKSKLSESSQKTQRFASELGSSLQNIGRTMSVALTLPLTAFAVKSVAAFEEHSKAVAQTAAVLKSTGNQAKVTAAGIDVLAKSLGRQAAIDDDVVRSGINVLLTFTNIHNELGRGNDIFDRATQAALDMSVALGTDLASAATLVGKALNDPTQGLAALTRVGIQFTDAQKAQIEGMAASGDMLGAQAAILDQLTIKFGGSAAAQVTASARMKVAFDDLAETVGSVLYPYITQLANGVDSLAQKMIAAAPETKALVVAIGALAAVAGPMINYGGSLATIFATMVTTAGSAALAVEALKLAMLRASVALAAFIVGFELGNLINRYVIDAHALTQELETGLDPALVDIAKSGKSVSASSKEMVKWLRATNDQSKTGVTDFTFALQEMEQGFKSGSVTAEQAVTVLGSMIPAAFRDAGVSAQDFVDSWLRDMSRTATGAEMARTAIQTFAGMTGTVLAEWEQQVKGNFDVVGDAFSGLKADAKTTAAEVNQSLLDQLGNWRTFRANLKTLLRRGVSQDALKYLREQGADAGGAIAAALVKGSDRDLREFNTRFKHSMNVQDTLNKSVDGVSTKLDEMARAYETTAHRVELAMARIRIASSLFGISSSSIQLTFKGIREAGVYGADGGIVTRPTLATIGESGPEAVIPLDRTPGSSALPTVGGGNLAVTVTMDRKTFPRQQEYLLRASGL